MHKACAWSEGLTLFVDALPGEVLTARVDKVKKGYAEASKLTTVEQHSSPAEPLCPYFGVCGGCNYQSLAYAAQLHAKQAQVAETLRHVGGISSCNDILLPIVPCQQAYHYRNNMQFTFSPGQVSSPISESPEASSDVDSEDHGNISIGLHKAHDPSKVVPIQACYLQHNSANVLLQAASQAVTEAASAAPQAQGQRLTAFNPATQQGFLRQLVLRRNSSNEYMVIISTSSYQPALLEPVTAALLSCGVAVLSIINTVVLGHSPAKHKHTKAASSRNPRGPHQQAHVLHGSPTITEQLCGLQFDISPKSFFQVNSDQAAVLYHMVLKAAELKSTDIVMDLFCGTGSIGLTLAQHCQHVYGFEVAASSIADAKQNAAMNNISNATFVQSDLTKVSASMGKHYPKPDVIVTDPARAGMPRELNNFLQQSGARTIVYVSCNPATQARDIAHLVGHDAAQYTLTSVQPCDMFPNTAHIECVAVLKHI